MVADTETFEIGWFTETGAKYGIKTYERMGFEKVSVRKDDAGGKIWVTFREVKK